MPTRRVSSTSTDKRAASGACAFPCPGEIMCACALDACHERQFYPLQRVVSGRNSGNDGFQPIGQVHQAHALRSVGTVKWVTDGHAAQIRSLLLEEAV